MVENNILQWSINKSRYRYGYKLWLSQIYFINTSHSSTGIIEPIIDKIEILRKYLTEVEFSCLGKN